MTLLKLAEFLQLDALPVVNQNKLSWHSLELASLLHLIALLKRLWRQWFSQFYSAGIHRTWITSFTEWFINCFLKPVNLRNAFLNFRMLFSFSVFSALKLSVFQPGKCSNKKIWLALKRSFLWTCGVWTRVYTAMLEIAVESFCYYSTPEVAMRSESWPIGCVVLWSS